MIRNENAHVLIVEDCESDLFLMNDLLSPRFPGTIKCIKDGKEALLYLTKDGIYKDALTPNLIILDLNLPKLNGKEILAKLKVNLCLCHIPVIIYSSSSDEKDINECYELGASCYIVKPFELEEFEYIIKSIKEHWIDNAELPFFST